MKINLNIIAIVLAIIAIIISLSQPTYDFLISNKQLTGKPSFNIRLLNLERFSTSVTLINNGTARAHNILLRLVFVGPNILAYNQFITELQNSNEVSGISFPIGQFQLQYGGLNITDYTLSLEISCDELVQSVQFTYKTTLGYID